LLELIKAGGWLMVPILLCSVVAMGIIAERFWTLQSRRIAPRNLAAQVWQWAQRGELTAERVRKLQEGSSLGRILAAGLSAQHLDRDRMKEHIEDVGRHVVHEMERYLNSLGTIASITPLLGLLGTVIGMIKVFAVITTQGIGDAGVLAGGISEALVTTAAGLTVAIPALMFYRYFRGRIDALVVTMEQEALKMVEALHAQPAAQVDTGRFDPRPAKN
jgi:biopolymer transport protein ExbB